MLRIITAIVLLAIVSLMVLLAACNSPEVVKREVGMVGSKAIPPIDTGVPAVTEAATFALG